LSLPPWISCHRMLLPASPEMYCCTGSSRKGGYRTWTYSSRNALTVVFQAQPLLSERCCYSVAWDTRRGMHLATRHIH
jgi:hypothetical protein